MRRNREKSGSDPSVSADTDRTRFDLSANEGVKLTGLK
jgi:hypothetical protein